MLLPNDEYRKRYESEKSIINSANFLGYMNIIEDVITYCKANNILTGIARGSVAGSLYAYVHGITGVDPLKYGLRFERFINPERITKNFPDIDTDVQASKRQIVLNYVKEKYKNVIKIGSLTKTMLSASVRDSARLYKVSVKEIENELKNIETVEELLDNSAFQKWLNKDTKHRDVFNFAQKLVGVYKNDTVHPAGIIIYPNNAVFPVKRVSGEIVTQWKDTDLSDMGYLKIDFLGLNLLDIIADVIDNVGNEAHISNIPLDDNKVYEMLNKGHTQCCFHVEAPHTAKVLRRYKVHNIEDISMVLAIAKPALYSLGITDTIIKRRHRIEPIKSIFGGVDNILKQTYGFPVYQETFMDVILNIGMSLYDAEKLREMIKKKKVDNEMKGRFFVAMKKQGANETQINNLWAILENAGTYCFNKSHSISYSLMTYWSAYLKHHYPREYLKAYTNYCNEEKRVHAFNEAKRLGIKLVYPSMSSKYLTYIQNGNFIVGFHAIKGIGEKMGNEIRKYVNHKKVNETLKKYCIIQDDDLFQYNQCDNCPFTEKTSEILDKDAVIHFIADFQMFMIENFVKWFSRGKKFELTYLVKCKPIIDGVEYDILPEYILDKCSNKDAEYTQEVYYIGYNENYMNSRYKNYKNITKYYEKYLDKI